MSERVLVDTGPIVAILSRSDQHHEVCVDELRKLTAPLCTCWPVLTEAAWLLRAYPASLAKLFSSFRGSLWRLLLLDEPDLPGIAAILDKYSGVKIQLADACLVHLANRENIDTVFTLDRRDFGIRRLGNGKKPRIIP